MMIQVITLLYVLCTLNMIFLLSYKAAVLQLCQVIGSCCKTFICMTLGFIKVQKPQYKYKTKTTVQVQIQKPQYKYKTKTTVQVQIQKPQYKYKSHTMEQTTTEVIDVDDDTSSSYALRSSPRMWKPSP